MNNESWTESQPPNKRVRQFGWICGGLALLIIALLTILPLLDKPLNGVTVFDVVYKSNVPESKFLHDEFMDHFNGSGARIDKQSGKVMLMITAEKDNGILWAILMVTDGKTYRKAGSDLQGQSDKEKWLKEAAASLFDQYKQDVLKEKR